MVKKCVAYGCSNVASPENGISLHKFPKIVDCRKIWNRNVAATRADWSEASDHSVLCSKHFTEDQFDIKPRLCTEFEITVQHERVLKVDAIPTIFYKRTLPPCSTKRSAAAKRQHARVRSYAFVLNKINVYCVCFISIKIDISA